MILFVVDAIKISVLPLTRCTASDIQDLSSLYY